MKSPRHHVVFASILLGLSLFLATASLAATSVGKVTQVVDSTRAGRQVGTGEAVFEGDTFVVGPSGSMIILFEDDSVLTLKAGSRATISTFRMGGKGKPGMALIKATDGKYRFTPGKILAQGGVQFVSKDTGAGAATGQGTLVAQNQTQGGSSSSTSAGTAGGTTAGPAGGAAISGGAPVTATVTTGGDQPGGGALSAPTQSGAFTPGSSGVASTSGGLSSSAPTQASAPGGSWTTMVASAGTPSTPNVAAGTWTGASSWSSSAPSSSGSDSGTGGGMVLASPGSGVGGSGGFVTNTAFSGMQDPCALGGCGGGPSGAPTGGNAIPAPDMMVANLANISAINSPAMTSFSMNMPSLNFNMAGLNLNMTDLGSFNLDQSGLNNLNNLNSNLFAGLENLNLGSSFDVASSLNFSGSGTSFSGLSSGTFSALNTFNTFSGLASTNLTQLNNFRNLDIGSNMLVFH